MLSSCSRGKYCVHADPLPNNALHRMQRSYPYKGFEVTIDLEPLWEPTGDAVPSLPSGFVAIVSIGMKGLPTPLVSPIRLMNEKQKPFETEAALSWPGSARVSE